MDAMSYPKRIGVIAGAGVAAALILISLNFVMHDMDFSACGGNTWNKYCSPFYGFILQYIILAAAALLTAYGLRKCKIENAGWIATIGLLEADRLQPLRLFIDISFSLVFFITFIVVGLIIADGIFNKWKAPRHLKIIAGIGLLPLTFLLVAGLFRFAAGL
jgi:hypothetical protein